MKEITERISFLGLELAKEIIDVSIIKEIPKGTVILREEQYVKMLPIVIEGLVKVYSRFEDRELLLYYIEPNESCIMSFSTIINNVPSKAYAMTEEDSRILLVPVDKVPSLLRRFPRFNNLFYQQYNQRYLDLLTTIHHLLIDKMDKRLYDYLKEKVRLSKLDTIKITHRQIANELGTVREVISRVMKKLEIDGRVKQNANSIKIL